MDLHFEDFFKRASCEKTRGNYFKLLLPKSKTKLRQNFFTCSFVRHWNELKSNDINVRNLTMFKKNVLRYLRRCDIW